MQEALKTIVSGHVMIKDDQGNVLVEKTNAIHPKNMATAIARGLSNSPNFQIYKLKLGNQGTYIDTSQQIVFRTPNITGDNADLYNPTYVEVVDEDEQSVGSGNSVTPAPIPASTSSRVVITAVISANEAYTNSDDVTVPGQIGGEGQNESGETPDMSFNPYFFDELGLFTRQTSGDTQADRLDGAGELMLSHLIFSPIEHTGSRELTIVYTLTISVS
jgi:hypothetical protein